MLGACRFTSSYEIPIPGAKQREDILLKMLRTFQSGNRNMLEERLLNVSFSAYAWPSNIQPLFPLVGNSFSPEGLMTMVEA